MDTQNGEGQVQIHLKTKQEQYAVPDVPYSVEGYVTATELNNLVNTLLEQASLFPSKPATVEFDFIVIEEYLRGRLCDHIREKGVSFEDVIEVEYIERFPAPEPKDCLLHDDWVSAVMTNNKWVLTGCYDNTINIWTIKGKHVLTIPGHSMPVKSVAWVSLDNEGGIFVSTSQDQTAMLWQWNIGKNSVECITVCKGHERGVDCVNVSPDASRFATGSWDTMLKIWSTDINAREDTSNHVKADKSSLRTPQLTLQGHRECISSVQWMDSAVLLTSSWDHTMKMWDLHLEGIKAEISTNKSIFDASFSKLNGLIVTASADKNIRLYDSRTNQGSIVRNTYFGHSQWIQAVMWSGTEEHIFVSGSYDNQIKLWDCRSPKAPLYDLIGHGDKVLDVDWSNSKYIVSGGADNTVRIYKSRKALNPEKNVD